MRNKASFLLPFSVIGVMAGCGEEASKPAPCNEKAGNICTYAGIGDLAFDGDGKDRRNTSLYWPTDVEFAPDGRAHVIDWNNHRIRRVNADQRFETVVGSDSIGDGPDDFSDNTAPGAPGTTVNLNHPTDLLFLPNGNLLVAAWHNHKIRRYDTTAGLVRVACGSRPGFAGDAGPAAMALLNQPKALALGPGGNVFMVDSRNHRIRKIAPDATETISTVAGDGMMGFAGDGMTPMQARFLFQMAGADNPEPGGGIAIDAAGKMYVLDTGNHRVRVIDLAANTVATLVGTGAATFGGDGGPATAAQLNYPRDLELGPDGRLYIADTDNHRIRAVDLSTGIITTVVGTGEEGFAGDSGPAAAAQLRRPFGVAFDAAGSLYIADTMNSRIRRVVMP